MLSTILRKHLKANHLISSLGLSIYWLQGLICWLPNKCFTCVCTGLAHQRGFLTSKGLDTVKALPNLLLLVHNAEACCGHTIRVVWHTKHVVLPRAKEDRLVSRGRELQQERPGMSCPACGGLDLGRSPQWSSKILCTFQWGKPRAAKGQKCKGEEEPDEQPQRKERLGAFLHCASWYEKQGGKWNLLAVSTSVEAGVNRGTGELSLGMGGEGRAGQSAQVAHCPGCERVHRLLSKPNTQHLPSWSLSYRHLFRHVVRCQATIQRF